MTDPVVLSTKDRTDSYVESPVDDSFCRLPSLRWSSTMLRVTIACFVLIVTSTLASADDHDSAEGGDSNDVIIHWIESLTELLYNEDVPPSIQYEVEPVTDLSFIASITNTTKTPDRHGLLRLRWDQQEIVNFKIFLAQDHFYVTEVNGYVQEKAPWGAWHREVEGVPDLYSRIVPDVGDVIALQ